MGIDHPAYHEQIEQVESDEESEVQIIKKQKLYSDKDVFKNIKKILGEIFNEKN